MVPTKLFVKVQVVSGAKSKTKYLIAIDKQYHWHAHPRNEVSFQHGPYSWASVYHTILSIKNSKLSELDIKFRFSVNKALIWRVITYPRG